MNAEDAWTDEHERRWRATSIPAAVAAKIEELRELYEAQGYQVVERPRRDEFPFEVGYFAAYRPSLLVRRGGENIVFEVRESAGSLRRSIERADEIRKHRNWRFHVVTCDDVVPHTSDAEPQAWWQLEQAVRETRRDIESLPSWMQLLAVWATLEGVLRRTAIDYGIPVELLPASTLITALYDHGPLPCGSYEPMKAAQEVHRRVRHGYPTPDERVAEAVRAVSEWLPQLLPHAVERAA